jgi:hypothetical protein
MRREWSGARPVPLPNWVYPERRSTRRSGNWESNPTYSRDPEFPSHEPPKFLALCPIINRSVQEEATRYLGLLPRSEAGLLRSCGARMAIFRFPGGEFSPDGELSPLLTSRKSFQSIDYKGPLACFFITYVIQDEWGYRTSVRREFAGETHTKNGISGS